MTILRASVQEAAEAQSYQKWTSVTLRFADTDKLGHVNNAVYATLFESGRCDFCADIFQTANESERLFTLARVAIDFVQEMHFPGDARVGTRVIAVGKSSITLGQAIFKDGVCHSVADSVLVLINQETRRSTPLTAELLDMVKSLRRSE